MRPNKFLGQHFLTSQSVVSEIIRAAELSRDDIVLEIGPGEGILTRTLAEHAGRVIAVEKDERFIEPLRKQFSDRKNVEIMEGDILQIQNLKIKNQNNNVKFKIPEKYKIVANIPYYITSRLFRLFLDEAPQKPERMVLMVQKEVAERIVARPPKMNLLALSVQAFSTPRIVARVPKTCFVPPPEVDSAVVAVTDISDTFFTQNGILPSVFFATAKKAFSQKRKMLRNSLGIEGAFAKKRPQDLSLDDWISLEKTLPNK